jgi:predicted RNA-binding protein YlxR (DUF448 family)
VTEPVRTCVGCGRKAPQSEVLRFTAQAGSLAHGRTLTGRAAYTCRRLSCFERAVAHRAFNRSLRRTVKIGPELQSLYTAGRDEQRRP